MKFLKIFSSVIKIIFIIQFYSCGKSIKESEQDTIPPQAMILFPIDGIAVNNETVILVRAVDNEIVSHVDFYINQELVHTDSSADDNDIFSYRWNTVEMIQNGDSLSTLYQEDEYQYLSIIAFDQAGNSYATESIQNKIDNIDNETPEAFILQPYEGQTISENFDITVIASDNDSIMGVQFYIDDRLEAVRPTTTLISETDPFGNVVNYHAYIYTWNTSLVDDGYHSIRVTVSDLNNNTRLVSPRVVIIDNGMITDFTPPNGAIVSPPAGLTVSGTIPIIVNAYDNIALGEVAFLINGIYVGTTSNSPYAFFWDTTQEDEDSEHILSAVVIDSVGNETPLNPVSVFVDNQNPVDVVAPSVLIMHPASGQTISGIINIEIVATDNDSVSHVVFYIDGNQEFVDYSLPFNYQWETQDFEEDWEHTIAAVAYDTSGNYTLTQPITVYLDNYDNIAPAGDIQNPLPGQIVDGNVSIDISATDNIGVSKVVTSINGNPRDTIFEEPYIYVWNTLLETEDEYHVISGEVSDSSGNTNYISPIVVFIDNHVNDITPPTGFISNPLSGQTVSGNVQFTVLAQDDYGISHIEYYIDGINVDTDDEYPYEYVWNTNDLENFSEHTLSATVSDNFNHTIILQPVLVVINNE